MSFNSILIGLTEISKVASRTEKEKIFQNLMEKDGERFKEVLNYTFNPMWNYHLTVEEAVITKPDYDLKNSNHVWDMFKENLDALRTGKISGNLARKAVEHLLKELGPSSAYAFWFKRILNKDLKIGLAGKTVTKYIPGVLPNYSPMLCDVLDLNEFNVNINSPYKDWYAEPKLDGLRALILVEKGKARAFSRAGKPLYNIDHILREIEDLKVDNSVFDGEIIGKNFKEAISILHTQGRHKDAENVTYWMFDCIPVDHWRDQKTDIPLSSRKAMLRIIKKTKNPGPHLKFVPSTLLITGSKVELDTTCTHYVDHGYEGIVIKSPESLYKWKRAKSWLKIKPYYECDLTITGIEEGQGKRKGRCGALIGEGVAKFRGNSYPIKTEVGAGLSEKQTIEFWKNNMYGRVMEVRFQEVSDWDVKKKVYALKFARLLRLRPDKD